MTAHPVPAGHAFRAATDDKLGYCLYRSLVRPDLGPESLDLILERARQSNRLHRVTGCLHFENGMFFQWIEGPWRRIFRLVDALHDDSRHLDMTILDQGSLSQRLFQDWEMRFSDRRAASLFDWLADWNSRPDDEAAYAERVAVFLRSIGTGGPGGGA